MRFVLLMTLVCCSSTDASKTFVDELTRDSPASWWRFGERDPSQPARDELGVANGSYRPSGVTLGAPGALARDANTAMATDGINGGMEAPGDAYDFGGTAPFAIEVWVSAKASHDPAFPIQRIATHRTAAPLTGWRLYFDGQLRVVFERWDHDVMVSSVTSKPRPPDEFSHVVVSADGSTVTLFVDGVAEADAPEGTIAIGASAANLSWAAKSDHFSNEFLSGVVDEGALYTHPLATDRVRAHYLAGRGLF